MYIIKGKPQGGAYMGEKEGLTHGSQDKMADVLQTTFSNAFS